MVLSLLQQSGDGDWEVWVALQDGDPTTQSESFCIGVGETKAGAFIDAARTLEKAAADLFALARTNGVRMHGSHVLDHPLNEGDGSYCP